jgi:glycosyltransferase 2 family protein
MKNSISKLLKTAQSVLNNRLVRWSLQGIILIACAAYLIANFQSTKQLLIGTDIDYFRLILACLLTLLAVFAGALGWRFILHSLGQRLNWRVSFHSHLSANLAKYIPGYAWQLVGKAYLTNQAGVSGRVVSTAMFLELSELLLLGAGLSLALVPKELVQPFLEQLKFNISIQVIHYLGVLVIFLTPLITALILVKTKKFTGVELALLPFIASNLIIFLGWLFFGLSFWFIGLAFFPLPASSVFDFIFTLAASVLIGLVIIFIPVGIGIRESLMVYFLTSLGIPSASAVLMAALSRLIIIICELFAYFCVQIIRPGSRKVV